MIGGLILIGTLILVTLAWILYGHWYNHISLFCAIWGVALFLFNLRLINYYPFEQETYIIIFAGVAAFILGSMGHWAWKFMIGLLSWSSPSQEMRSHASRSTIEKYLMWTLWCINAVTLAAIAQHWYVATRLFGGVTQVLLMSNILYSYRVEHGLPGSVPYLKSLTLLGALYGGVLTALRGRLKLVSVMPIIIVFLGDLVIAGRATTIQAGVFFLSGMFLSGAHWRRPRVARARSRNLTLILSLVVVIALIIGGMELIRVNRGGAYGTFRGSTSTLKKTNELFFISPSLYLYVTCNFSVLDQYLKHQDERTPWGGNSFGPVYHILEKLGFDTKMSFYSKFYRTPVWVNTGTYLRDLHADFGLFGVLIYPYILGFLASVVWFKLKEGFRFTTLVIAGCLFAILAMSLFVNVLRGGDLYVVTAVGLLLGRFLDKKGELQPRSGEAAT